MFYALALVCVVKCFAVNASCNHCLEDSDCSDFCENKYEQPKCADQGYYGSNVRCCVCKGLAKRHRPDPCTSNHDCATHHCHSSHEVPYCDHAHNHCECAHCLSDHDCRSTQCHAGEVPFCRSHTCECHRHVYGNWQPWSTWSSCSSTCGHGTMTRTRHCDTEPTHPCQGQSSEEYTCNNAPCAVWSNWSAWSSCSLTCGTGTQSRTRTCSGSHPCSGDPTETRSCKDSVCSAVDGGWTNWSDWGSCSTTCGYGQKRRFRSCSNPSPEYGGLDCFGESTELMNCLGGNCTADGDWSKWMSWSTCSNTCGTGWKIRSRECNNPPPFLGGQTCNGLGYAVDSCTVSACAVDGGWADWMGWSTCSESTVNGMQFRYRSCTNPGPSHGGMNCNGSSMEMTNCSHPPAIDGSWGHWSSWDTCSATCGPGVQIRTRNCTHPAPQNGGLPCPGSGIESKNCSATSVCIVDGGWSNWNAWSPCSSPTGDGWRIRARTCSNPSPLNGGHDCVGLSFNSVACSLTPTFEDGGWSSWEEWSSCSVSCGVGVHSRSRSCTNPAPLGGGKDCSGNNIESSTCDAGICAVDGGWNLWTAWTPCSVTCGSGEQTRHRKCSNPEPVFGGKPCSGESTESKNCHLRFCSVDGAWSSWLWSSCSSTCGSGWRIKGRTCTNPAPLNGGKPCSGHNHFQESCSLQPCPVDGGWTDWHVVSGCSVTCGSGLQKRTRTCTNPPPAFGGKSCSGNDTDHIPCMPKHCSVDGEWSNWKSWSTCSNTCGEGYMMRVRSCNNPSPAYGGKECPDTSYTLQSCNLRHCPVDGEWNAWTGWSACSVTCGSGRETRTRHCNNPAPEYGGKMCPGNTTESKSCYPAYCSVDGGWSVWQTWGRCSVTCGNGVRNRARSCNNPVPQYGGNQCAGDATEIHFCHERSCPVDGAWSIWSGWGSCSRTCGDGTRIRSRSCTNPAPLHGGHYCYGHYQESMPCYLMSCPVDGHWANWMAWTSCSSTCGYGVKTRAHTCTNPAPSHGGKDCAGSSYESHPCQMTACSVDGQWADWMAWTSCSSTCGDSVRTRARTCSNPAPSQGGQDCAGSSQESHSCHMAPCSVDGGWSAWIAWSPCSSSCGNGQKTRARSCVNPAPSAGGKDCVGSIYEMQPCFGTACSVDGGWGAWATWSHCSKTCGSGVESRARSCDSPTPSGGGQPCAGDTTETRTCNLGICAIDGHWSDWMRWSPCSSTCGSGMKTRARMCTNPAPSQGGKDCVGSPYEMQQCFEIICPVDGNWGDWSSWSQCSASCGGGNEVRSRNCSNPAPSHGGKPCAGDPTQSQTCANTTCPVGPDCPSCDENLNCQWGSVCDVSETCMIRSFPHSPFTVHCSKIQDCEFEKSKLPKGEIFCCYDRSCLTTYLGLTP